MRLVLSMLALLAALPAAARESKDLIQRPETKPIYDRWHYADGMRAGPVVFFSGVVGVTRDGPNDPKTQFERAFDRVGKVLQEARLSWDDVVDITTYVVDLQKNFPALADVHAKYVKEPYPTWTAIGVTELLAQGAVLEIRVVAKQK